MYLLHALTVTVNGRYITGCICCMPLRVTVNRRYITWCICCMPLTVTVNRRYFTGCISCIPLEVTVNTIAECLRTDCNILEDNKKKIYILHQQSRRSGKCHTAALHGYPRHCLFQDGSNSVDDNDRNNYRALDEWQWQRKTDVLGNTPVSVPLCPPQTPRGLPRVTVNNSTIIDAMDKES